MDDISRKKLETLIKKNARLFNLKLVRKKEDPFVIWEDYHLSAVIEYFALAGSSAIIRFPCFSYILI